MTELSRRPQVLRALRLLIEYDGRKLAVRERQQVEMATPPSDPLRGYDGQSGFWYELRDAKGRVLYRRIVNNPIRYEAEAHDPETGIRRYPIEKPRGVFAVLVPVLPEADSLVVVSSPLDPGKSAAPAEPLARIPLGQKRKAR